jgi:hypothetical protein
MRHVQHLSWVLPALALLIKKGIVLQIGSVVFRLSESKDLDSSKGDKRE